VNESNAKVRIGFVGCGMMGQTVHLPNFVSLPDCEVVALSELRERVGRQVAAKFGIPAFYTSFEEMLAQQHLDAVVMILQYSQNPELAPIVLQSGKPVYLEKPIALSAADGQTIAQAAAANGTDAMVAYHKRYDPGVEKAKALIDEFRASGSLGGIVGARVWNHHGDWIAGYSREQFIDDPNDPKPSLETARSQGAPEWIEERLRGYFDGMVGNLCHDVNLMRFLIGDPQAVSHAAVRPVGMVYNPPGVTVFDYGDFDCAFETGAVNSEEWDEGMRVNFERGYVEVRVVPPLLRTPSLVRVQEAGKGTTELPIEPGWAFTREAAHFVNCVADSTPFHSNAADSGMDLSVFEALFRSLQEGAPVEIATGG